MEMSAKHAKKEIPFPVQVPEPPLPRQGLRQAEDREADEEGYGGGSHEKHVFDRHPLEHPPEAQVATGRDGHALPNPHRKQKQRGVRADRAEKVERAEHMR